MDNIIISLNGHAPAEIENGDFFHSLTWDALMPTITKMVSLRPYEKIDGLIISPEDIRVKISQKVGRKAGSSKGAEQFTMSDKEYSQHSNNT